METIRYSQVGAQDIKFGTGTFEVTLADGRVVVFEQVNASHVPGDQVNETVDATQLDVYRARRGLTQLLDFDQDDATTTGLTWGYTSGMSGDGTGAIAKGTLTLTANSTNYVEYDPELGTLAVNTSAFSPTDKVPIRKLVTNASAITTNTDVRPIWRQNVNLLHGQCYLSLVSASSIKLLPRDGNRLIINGTTQTIPAAGVALSNAGLTISTTYYLYAYMNGSTMTLEAATTVHATSSTDGVEIKSGDQTRTYVGSVDVDGSGNFEADIRQWFLSGGLVTTHGLNGLGIMPRSYLAGLTLANNSGDATNDIDIAVGACRDASNFDDMVLGSALTKRLDAAWAVGTSQGGLDTGAIANTTYHVWLIKRPDTGVVDALFSASASAPTMPTNYTLKRRIGSIIRSAGAIVAFIQDGDLFQLKVPINEWQETPGGTTAVTKTLTMVPAGVQVLWKGVLGGQVTSAGAATGLLVSDLDTTDTAAGTIAGSAIAQLFLQPDATAGNTLNSTEVVVRVSTSAGIRARSSTTTGVTWTGTTIGWWDRRGRDA